MRLGRFIIATALLGGAIVSASPFPYVVHEERSQISSRWQKRSPLKLYSRAMTSQDIVMRIALTHQNLDVAEQALMGISQPDSPSYGQHWTVDRISKEFAPSDSAIEAVKNWLTTEGISEAAISLSTDKSWFKVRTNFDDVASLLKTEFHVYHDTLTGNYHISCDSYSVPESVQTYIDFITPTQLIPRRAERSSTISADVVPLPEQLMNSDPDDLSNCEQAITPACIRKLYNIPLPLNSTNRDNALGIVELSPEGQYSQIDLDLFFSNYSKSMVGKFPFPIGIDGGVPQYTENFTYFDGLLEADMDLELAMSLVGHLNVSVYTVGDQYHGGSFGLWLDALDASYCTFEGGDVAGQDPVYPDNSNATSNGGKPYNHTADCGTAPSAYVYSLSLASIEETDAASLAYQRRMCTEFMKLTMQGSTFLFASDDYGVGGPQAVGCGAPNDPPGSTLFTPAFPATCPWVTAVGGSAINFNNTVYDSEVAYGLSGGGFSNVFSMPTYQKKAVLDWFNHTSTGYPDGTFNTTKKARAIPDLAANAVNTVVASNGIWTSGGGTSAATPIVAAILALINDKRLDVGKGPVGFINPVIYANPQAFNDVILGNNAACNTGGFNATAGWDPVTGLGTPDYEKLLKVFLDLQ
ncbi:peptidase S8/S53 domain-containing protein [Talaromyces proteolyticus]|uniref:tripeptidyl-peptidase II n=1 Tax=Talaromyces proteolyticus TaxID=1131652 RepID=A0AAD4KL94_9EURO|nr:peptidase S8/S53 domain-containing protein [Talaromyces proteolyticus]KAH8693874.1 peptidase S8/S53 domain-containing protein [Talaromyces proteolyticus]